MLTFVVQHSKPGAGKIAEKRNLSEGFVHRVAEDSVDALEKCMSHHPSIDANETELQQERSTPKRTQSILRSERVDTSIQTNMDYQTSGGLHWLHTERLYRRSESPNKFYNHTVCLTVLHPGMGSFIIVFCN